MEACFPVLLGVVRIGGILRNERSRSTYIISTMNMLYKLHTNIYWENLHSWLLHPVLTKRAFTMLGQFVAKI